MKPNSIRLPFYFSWIFLLFMQAGFTELLSDEAYYWCYSRELSWGYFDHPPAIALMIKAGYSLFQNEIGVRLFSILASALTIYVWELIIQPKNKWLFYSLVLSVGVIHFFGFFATPDSPFLLLVSCFLLFYRRFLERPDIKISLLLALCISFMILSKYHGIVVVFITILSNFKLLTNRFFWLIAIVSASLLIPHFLWQLSNGFPSFNYHLYERAPESYSLYITFEYVVLQPFVTGPFAGIIFFISAWFFKPQNPFEKTLKFLFWGAFIFFLLMTFKGRVEPHWTLFSLIPSFYFAYRHLLQSQRLKKFFSFTFPIAIVAIVAVRILVAVDLLPHTKSLELLTQQFHDKKEWTEAIKKKAGSLPVAFMNSYQKASIYSFYSGHEGFSINNLMGRKNQYELWNMDDKYRGRPIMLVFNYDAKEFEAVPGIDELTRYTYIDNFQSFSKIRVNVLDELKETVISDTLNINVQLKNTAPGVPNFEADPNSPSFLCYYFFEGSNLLNETVAYRLTNSMVNKAIPLQIIVPPKAGRYNLYIAIKTGILPPGFNSQRYRLTVKEK